MALTEASINLLPLNNGGVPQSMSASAPSEPASSVADSALETNENTEQKARATSKIAPPNPNLVKQNCCIQPSLSSTSPSSAFLPQFNSPKLLPTSLPHHSPACCPFQEPECCNGSQQEGSLFQGPLHSRRVLHMGPCCVQGAPSFCMQQQWQERFQNQPNMTTFRNRFTEFGKGERELDDNPGSVRVKEAEDKELQNLLDEDETQWTGDLERRLNLDHSAVLSV